MSAKTGSKFTIKVGDTIRNNDPRYDWTAIIERIIYWGGDRYYAVLHPPGAGRVCKVRFDRIFVDGGKHAQGYSLVHKADALPAGVLAVSLEVPEDVHNAIATALGEPINVLSRATHPSIHAEGVDTSPSSN